MAEVASAFVSLMPSARGFGRATERQIGGEMNTSGRRIGATMGRALLLGGTAAIGAGFVAAKFLKGAIEEAQEAAVVTARTENVIRQMGDGAGYTAERIALLAQSISNKVGIDDEAIQSGTNMLLTFGNIRNEVGEGNNIFARATELMVDMSKAMGTDMKSSSIQLGKALNDPIKGVTALSRVGVSFTEQQIEQIKSMTEANNILGAQKIILGEVEKQFGGAAEAMATPAEKAQVAWDNLKEQLGTELLPVFNKVASWLSTKAIPAVSAFLSQMRSGKGAGGEFANVLGNIGGVIQNIAGWIRNDFLPAWQSFANWMRQNVLPGLMDFIRGVGGGLKSAFANVNQAIQDNRPFINGLIVGLKDIGKFIGTVVLPAMGQWARVYFPALGKAIGIGIDAMRIITDMVLTFVIVGSRAFRMFLQVVMITFGNIIEGAAKAFGWMPGIGPKVKAANEAFHSLGNTAITELQSIENQARAMGAALDAATRDRTVTVSINTVGTSNSFGGRTVDDFAAPSGAAGKTAAPMGGKVDLSDRTLERMYRAVRDGVAEKRTSEHALRRVGG